MNLLLKRYAAIVGCLAGFISMACMGGGGGGGSGSEAETTAVTIRISFSESGEGQGHHAAWKPDASAFALGTAADVAAMTVSVTDGATPLGTTSLTKNPVSGEWSGSISDLPIGPMLTFTVSGQTGDSPPEEIFAGSESRVLSGNDQITIRLSPVPGPTLTVPRILSIGLPGEIVQGDSVSVYFELQGSPSESLQVSITPEIGGGTFTPASTAIALATSGTGTLVVQYTAPSGQEAVYAHVIQVTNSQGNSVSVGFSTNIVTERTGIGMSIAFNPVVISVSSQRIGGTVTWEAEVDDDGPMGELTFSWEFSKDTGIGAVLFDPDDTNPAAMTGYEETVSGEVSLAVTDLDGLGGTTSIAFELPVGLFPDSLQFTPDVITYDAVERGWWSEVGEHTSTNEDTFTGQCCEPGRYEYRSYFEFNLSDVPPGSTVISATLKLEVVNCVICDEEETLSVRDVITDSVTLNGDSASDTAVFDDLGSGYTYGSFAVSDSSIGTVVPVLLNSQAVSDINAALGSLFAVGLHADTLRDPFDMDEGITFGGDNEVRVHQLELILKQP